MCRLYKARKAIFRGGKELGNRHIFCILVTNELSKLLLTLSDEIFLYSIEIVVVVLVVAILATVVLVTYRKLQSKNETSKLVKCSHVLCPGRRQEANAGNKDIGTTEEFFIYQP